MAKSTTSRRSRKPATKPEKPYKGFPLFPHATGRWAKKIRQKTHFFGRWGKKVGTAVVPLDDMDESARKAMEDFNRQWPYLSEGRTPPPIDTGTGCTMSDLCNAFLTAKLNKVATGELSERSFRDYHATTDLLIGHFGKTRRVDDLRTDDFESLRKAIAKRSGIVTLKNDVNRCRVVFKFAWDQRLIGQPVNYGQSFDRPSAKMLRRARNEAGPRMFERDELLRILDALDGKPVTIDGEPEPDTFTADQQLKAMVLLGLNCGFGNTDVACLPQSAIKDGWVTFPRPKTEIPRRIPLWPETLTAVVQAIATRREPVDSAHADLCFLTRTGKPWVRVHRREMAEGAPPRAIPIDPLTQRFARLLKALKIEGRSFYTLRHQFETIGGESRDQVAVNAIMGHVDSSMAGQYRERISDDRLRAVANTVHKWLFAPSEGGAE